MMDGEFVNGLIRERIMAYPVAFTDALARFQGALGDSELNHKAHEEHEGKS